jgi:hypothetical protein
MRIRMPHTRQYGRGGRRTLAGERTEGHDESDREQNITVRADRGRPSPLLRSWFTVHLNANHNNAVGHRGGQMLSAAGKNRRSYSPRGHGQLRCPNLLDVRTHGLSLLLRESLSTQGVRKLCHSAAHSVTSNGGEQRRGCFRRAWISDHAQPKATRYEDCDLFAL